VVLDSRLRLPLRSQLVRTANRDVLVFTAASTSSLRARTLQRAGIELVNIRCHPERSEGSLQRLDLSAVLRELGRRNILSLMLEPGPTLHQAALDAGIVDKVRLFYAPILAGLPLAERKPTPGAHPVLCNLRDLRIESFGPDFAVEGYIDSHILKGW
jgi:diaminohydroxyphosphoribosylaminopyrimidine deaminase/5-amino-6-(5-phosphoribosylamino)uracil reductase